MIPITLFAIATALGLAVIGFCIVDLARGCPVGATVKWASPVVFGTITAAAVIWVTGILVWIV